MNRIDLVLLGLVAAAALGTVTARHEARSRFVELERAREAQKQLDEDYGRLQIEQGTWAMHTRIEQVAVDALGMQVPAPDRVRVAGAGAPIAPTAPGVAAPAAPRAASPARSAPARPAPAAPRAPVGAVPVAVTVPAR
ncbi:MAG: cell division protein FtsL [Burkholderiales bacterium]|nr:cell division protein FtsL [Burkholderiales bacterium]